MLFIILEHVKKYYKIMDSRSRELAIEVLEKALVENSRMLEILNFPDPKYKKIYLDENKEIGEVLKLIDRQKRYAHQCLFAYGWDYCGAIDGKRVTFNSYKEAKKDLDQCLSNLKEIGWSAGDWRVNEYIEAKDSKLDL